MIVPAATVSIPIATSQQIQFYPFDSYDSYPSASLDNRAPQPGGFHS